MTHYGTESTGPETRESTVRSILCVMSPSKRRVRPGRHSTCGIVASMPTWTPNWNPVVIDEVGLLDAIADCAAAIATIEEGHRSLAPFVARARDQWEGPARLDFDDDYAAFAQQVDSVIGELHQASLSSQRELAEAYDEQARRWAQQEQWQRELAAEEAAFAAEREAARRRMAEKPQPPVAVSDSPGDGDLI